MCPQSNTLWGPLTVDQTLSYLATVKGLRTRQAKFQAEFLKQTLDLNQYSTTAAMHLSGGNKRKLVSAMSLLCCP